MNVVEKVIELQKQITVAKAQAKTVVFVPTMGALHEGHLSLIRQATQVPNAFVVVSIFVNPTQFGKNEDFDKYPRTLDKDLESLEQLATPPDLIFVPNISEVYPTGIPEIKPRAGALGSVFEGLIRPGHFDGMLHVVAWFFSTIKPDVAIFGAKDAQQLFLIKRMVRREFAGIEIIEGETVREDDGLALSSRNRFLSAEARKTAGLINKILFQVEADLVEGIGIEESLSRARIELSALPLAKLDYLALVDKQSFNPVTPEFRGVVTLITAVKLEEVRLIDNITFTIQEPA